MEEEQKACPQCGSTNIVQNEETGQLICKDCGAKMEQEE